MSNPLDSKHVLKIGYDIFDLDFYHDTLQEFKNKSEKEFALKSKSIITIDTNVLLRYYEVSKRTQSRLLKFFEKNKKRIWISNIVKNEFIKKRQVVIEKNAQLLSKSVSEEFKSKVLNGITNFRESYVEVLNDFGKISDELKELTNRLTELYDEIKEESQTRLREYDDLLFNDELLKVLSEFNVMIPLEEIELSEIRKSFEELSEEYVNNGTKNLYFPGRGDIKIKRNSSVNDFIIFHEILKFMLHKDSDVSFLTFDTLKSDWIKPTGPVIEYFLHVKKHSNRLLFIIDADRSLPSILESSVDSIFDTNSAFGNWFDNLYPSFDFTLKSVPNPRLSHGPLDLESLTFLINEFDRFREIPFRKKIPSENLIAELKYAGYKSASSIWFDLSNGFDEAVSYFNSQGVTPSNIGLLRMALRTQNPKYRHVFTGTEFVELPQDVRMWLDSRNF